MYYDSTRKWISIASLIFTIKQFNAELSLPPYVPQIQRLSLREPLKIVVVLPPIEDKESTSTPTKDTSMTERAIPLAMPVPMPNAVQIAVPAMSVPPFCQGKPCPPCPPCLCAPSCTPSFFSYCSPCHQKCRCHRIEDAPQPMPLNPPQPLLGPVFAMPAPRQTPPIVLIHYDFPWYGYN